MLERKSEGLAKLGVNGELYVAFVGVEAYNKIKTAAYFGKPAAIPKVMVNGIAQGALGLPIWY